MSFQSILEGIYKLATSDKPLGRKVYISLEIISLALDIYGLNKASLSFNGGKDCTVTLFLILAAININAKPVTHEFTTLSREFFKGSEYIFENLNRVHKDKHESKKLENSSERQKSEDFGAPSRDNVTSEICLIPTIDLSAEDIEELFKIANKRFFDLTHGTECLETIFYNTKVSTFLSKQKPNLLNPEKGFILAPIKSLYVKTSEVFPEVESFIEMIVKEYKLDLYVISNSMKEGLFDYKKVNPNCDAFYIGTRRDDPIGKYSDYFKLTDPGWPEFVRICPILDWSYKDIWMFMLDNKIPHNSMYDKGYTSIGDIKHTTANPNLLENGHYKPAWLLADSVLERNGRK